MSTLYFRLGREAGIRALVDRLCELVQLDPLLRPHFPGDTTVLREQVVRHLTAVAGGRPAVVPAAAGGLDDAQFGRVTYYLAAALHERRLPAREIDELLIAARGLRAVLTG